jgi:predicted nucleic acid-binding protein
VADAVYLDSSALVKLVAVETETAALTRSLRDVAARVSSEITVVEVRRAGRRFALEEHAGAVIDGLVVLELTPEILEASASVDPPTLGTLDAIHLATALANREHVDRFVAYDRALLSAAEAAGLQTASPS